MGVVLTNCVAALTNSDGIEIIPVDYVPNGNMQFESGPVANQLNDDLTDNRVLWCVRVDNPDSDTWPTTGDVLTVLEFDDEPRNVGDWEIVRMEPGGFSTLLLYVKAALQLEPNI